MLTPSGNVSVHKVYRILNKESVVWLRTRKQLLKFKVNRFESIVGLIHKTLRKPSLRFFMCELFDSIKGKIII